MRSYLVSIAQEGRFFVARCPELDVTTQGESLAEAERNMKEAIALWLESFAEDEVGEEGAHIWTAISVG